MPEMTFTVRWPDGSVESCYSPSLVMHDYLETGRAYPVVDFVALSGRALREASARVRQKYGMECTSARQQHQQIEERAAAFTGADVEVAVLEMNPPSLAAATSATASTTPASTPGEMP